MANSPTKSVLHHFRHVTLLRDESGLSDGQLLESFISQHDEAAFAALLRRHGPMVLGVCRRVLGNVHDAEDAFQATFLVLVRKAASVMPREMVGNWLYGVARRTALEAKKLNARRQAKEKQVKETPQPTTEPAPAEQELLALLDQELSRLPDRYRVAVVLCELEGRSRKEVAGQLGIPEGTLSSRLATARKRLARRLARQGLTLSTPAVPLVVALPGLLAAPAVSLFRSTRKAATRLALGEAATRVVSTKVAALMEGVIKVMLLAKWKMPLLVVLALAFLIAGASLFTVQTSPASYTGRASKPSVPGTFAPEDKPKTDKELLQGTWQVVHLELGGKLDENDAYKLHFVGDQCKREKKGRLEEGHTYMLDPSKKPREITLFDLGKPEPGIYELDGDTLTLCYTEKGEKRPAEFKSKPGTDVILLVLQRQKTAENDKKLIQGTWKMRQAEANGRHLPKEVQKEQKWTITDKTITIQYNDGTKDQWNYQLDPTQTPRALDVRSVSGIRATGSAVGIYYIHNNEVRLCLTWSEPKRRPREFDAFAENDRGRRLFVLVRQ